MYLYGRSKRSKRVLCDSLLRAIMTHFGDITTDEFVERGLRGMSCEWCRQGLSVDEKGITTYLGL
jgi:hypothetical protein